MKFKFLLEFVGRKISFIDTSFFRGNNKKTIIIGQTIKKGLYSQHFNLKTSSKRQQVFKIHKKFNVVTSSIIL